MIAVSIILSIGIICLYGLTIFQENLIDKREHQQQIERLNKAKDIASIVVVDKELSHEVRNEIDMVHPKIRVDISENEERERDELGRYKKKRRRK